MNIYLEEIVTLANNTKDSSWGGYVGLFFLFLIIIGFGIWLVFFAKWLKYGPKFKRSFNKTKAKIKGKMDKSGPKVQRGAVISNQVEVNQLEEEIVLAKTPQELLAAQNKKIAYNREVKLLEEKLAKEQLETKAKELAKVEAKAEKEAAKKEIKVEKEQAKQNKKDQKEEKRSEK